MNIKRFLFSIFSVLALIPIYQNCAKKTASFSLDTSKTAALADHMGITENNGNGYEIIHDQGDGVGEVTPDQLYTNLEGGDASTAEDDPTSPEGNSIEPNKPESNPMTPNTNTQNADGSPVVPLNCTASDNLDKECVDNPVPVPPAPAVVNDAVANIKFDLERWCRGRKDKGNVMGSEFLNIKIVGSDGKILCQHSSSNLIDEVLNEKTLTLPKCDIAKLPGDAMIYLSNDLDLSIYHADDKASYDVFKGTVKKSKVVHSENTKASAVKVSIANYLKHGFLPILIKDNHRNSKMNKVAACDKYDGSPLVIDMRAYSLLNTPFYLSDPAQGKLFNILGNNSDPVPNKKIRISWLTDNRVMFLVLPKNGSVNGVDEMFGDSTVGPDGFEADNGFKALAKYDAYSFNSKKINASARNGIINSSDEVFAKLRLWYDKNLDAVVDAGELVSLDEAGVKSIDLGYNPKFHVRDSHGNHIKFKSAVEMTDGKIRPIFDIWFKIDQSIQ